MLGGRCSPQKLVIADLLPSLSEVSQRFESFVGPSQVPEPARFVMAVLFAPLNDYVPAQFLEGSPFEALIMALHHRCVLCVSLVDHSTQLQDKSRLCLDLTQSSDLVVLDKELHAVQTFRFQIDPQRLPNFFQP